MELFSIRIQRTFQLVSTSQALKEAWRRAKKEAAQREESEKRMASMKSSKADQRNARMYQHVVFGKNDWAIDYGRKYRY